MVMRSESVFCSVNDKKTGMAASGLATEIMEVKAAINRAVDPDRYVEKKSFWVKRSSNIIGESG